MSQSRNWCATWNNYPQNWKELLPKVISARKKTAMVVYWLGGKEKGEKGTPHLQMCLQTETRMKMTTFQKALKKAGVNLSLQVMKGTWKQAKDYCKKDGDWEQQGEEPEEKQPGRRTDVLALRDGILEGKTDLELANDDACVKALAQFQQFTTKLRASQRAQDARKRQEEAMKDAVLRDWQKEAAENLDMYVLPPVQLKWCPSRTGSHLLEFGYFKTHDYAF